MVSYTFFEDRYIGLHSDKYIEDITLVKARTREDKSHIFKPPCSVLLII
jgi:hypothetical protein